MQPLNNYKKNMKFYMKQFLVFTLIIALSSCISTKYFRKVNKDESSAIKMAKKLVPKKATQAHVLIMTDSGNMIVKLYNETPLHKDNFIKKIKAGFYDSLLFHRVISNFMIQGGDPLSKNANESVPLGSGEATGGKIPTEIKDTIFHKRGVLAAARDGNPEKASSNCQFYLAQGKIYTPEELEKYALQRNLNLGETQKKLYTTVGGIPHLDGAYTVYGEIFKGLDVLDRISVTKTNRSNRPLIDIRMKMFLLYEPQ